MVVTGQAGSTNVLAAAVSEQMWPKEAVRQAAAERGDGRSVEHREGDVGDLVRSARLGTPGAFDELVLRYQRQATSVAYRLLNNRDDAMEITQDAFLRAFEKLRSLAEPERFGPWLMRIVSNLALNRRRARALRMTASLDVSGGDDDRGGPNLPDGREPAPPAAAAADELEGLLSRAIDELPERQRMALVLFSIEKMPQNDVAEILGCSVEAVKWHVFTARKKLKDRLKDYL